MEKKKNHYLESLKKEMQIREKFFLCIIYQGMHQVATIQHGRGRAYFTWMSIAIKLNGEACACALN